MITHSVVQGTPEWHALRASHFCASDAPAMLGLSKRKTRNDLIREKATGVVADVDAGTQVLFNRGHEAEESARPIAESYLGEDLYPAVGAEEIEGLPLLASFDGLTMDDRINFEHKLFNQELAQALEAGDLPGAYWPQVEQQMLLSGSEETLFVTSDGTENRWVSLRYASHPVRREKLIAGWKQFAADLAAYVPQEQTVAPVAAPIEALPAVFVQVQGSLAVSDNLKVFGAKLAEFVERINRKPETDQDFADAEAAIKALSKAEDALQQAKAGALEQIASVADMQRAVDLHYDLARGTRLMLEKLVKAEKENRRTAIVMAGRTALADHVAKIDCKRYMPDISADFGGVIKGLKSLDSIKNAVDTELARAKIAANEMSDKIRANLAAIESAGEAHLFADKATLVLKAPDDLAAVISQRITAYQAREAARIEAERERIRAEEQAKAQREAAAAAEAERQRVAAEERLKAFKAAAAQSNFTGDESNKPRQEEARGPAVVSAPAEAKTEKPALASVQTTEVARAAVVEHQDEIRAFLASRDFKMDENKVRAILVEFVKFQNQFKHKEAA